MKAVALLGWFAVAGGFSAYAAVPAAIPVTASPQVSNYSVTGTVEAVRQGTLAAQLSGRIIEVLVRSGDAVKAGDPLIRIEGEDAQDAATAAAASATGAAARLITAAAEFERARRLREQDYISVAALQRSESALRSAEADAQAADAIASQSRLRARWRVVTAPYAGQVTKLYVSAGDLAIPGKPLIALYDPTAFRVIAQVPAALIAQLQTAGTASIVGLPGVAPIEATRWAAVNALDAVSRSAEVRIDVPAGTMLQPGQFVRVLLPLEAGPARMRIPTRAVVHRSDVTAVYVLDASGTARLRQVRLGPVEGDSVTVLAGLRDGEQVVLDPIAAGSQ